MKVSAINPNSLILAIGAVALGFYITKKITDASGEVVATVIDSINPTNRENIVNETFNYFTENDEGESLGSQFADHCIANGFPWYCPKIN